MSDGWWIRVDLCYVSLNLYLLECLLVLGEFELVSSEFVKEGMILFVNVEKLIAKRMRKWVMVFA